MTIPDKFPFIAFFSETLLMGIRGGGGKSRVILQCENQNYTAMKYINLINEFWRKNAIEPFSPTDIAVYFYMLNQCNLRHWENPFSVTAHQMEVALNISRKTIMMSRNRLQKRGLLTVKNRGKKPVLLTLADCDSSLEGHKYSHSGEQEEEQTGNKPVTNPTHIKRDKNKDKRFIKKHSIECKKSESISENSNDCSDDTTSSIQPEDSTSASPKIEDRNQGNSARYVAFLDWVAEKAPYVAKNLKPLSEPEFDRLIMRFGAECLARNVDNLENRRDLRRRYTSLYRTMLNWCAQDPLAK